MRAIVNNTVLSNLAHVRRPDLLRKVFGKQVAVTRAVLDELAMGERWRRLPICDWSWLTVIELFDKERAHAEQLNETVALGEATCLAVAQARGLIFLTDDRDARRFAQILRIPISGTLGILQSLVDDDYFDLEAADALLVEMIRKGYRSPTKSLKQLDR